ncbi:hypothetical protein V9T40_005314 [Parthenolecanium corni]|uniref:RRM domain-containing protein n=1 Tax=Parthenolecanium corni TaxID=536013 RepID=A0AAN9TEX5_9HEMI
MNLDSNGLESTIGNMRTSLSPQSEDIRNSKLMLDLSLIKSSVSSLFSDCSISIGSSNSDMSLFPNSIQTCRSDSPKSETSSHSAESVSTHTAQFTWSGKLPKRSFKRGPYSSKVFLGGVSWDITEEMLICSFHRFGNVKVELLGKDSIAQPKGYAYIIFENEMQVKLLLESCREGVDENEDSFYYIIPFAAPDQRRYRLFLGQQQLFGEDVSEAGSIENNFL